MVAQKGIVMGLEQIVGSKGRVKLIGVLKEIHWGDCRDIANSVIVQDGLQVGQ